MCREIIKALERNSPFVLRMADGRQYRVPHRDFIAIPPNVRFVVVVNDQGKGFDVLALFNNDRPTSGWRNRSELKRARKWRPPRRSRRSGKVVDMVVLLGRQKL